MPPARRGWALAAAAAAAMAAGCDNPACIFGANGCSDDGTNPGGPGGVGSAAAVFPADTSWLAQGNPLMLRSAPGIIDAHTETPLIVEFDQSLDPTSLRGAFELVHTLSSMEIPLVDPPALVGDGRVVVVSPVAPLQPGSTYVLRFAPDQRIADVTGQTFNFGSQQEIFEVGVTATPPAAPRLLYSFPADGSLLASDLAEIVVVFDRRMDASSFSTSSFVVTTEGVPPMPNPPPSSLLLTGGQVAVPVTQVWRWTSLDGSGVRHSLGADADISVVLSPAGNPLRSHGGAVLPTTEIDFRTAALRAPLGAVKAPSAAPPDSIGIANLEAGQVLEVTLPDPATANTVLDVFVIGRSPINSTLLKAEQRSVDVTAGATSVLLGEAELDLRESNGTPRFADGEIEFMVRSRSGAAATVARRTDADPNALGFQRLVLDLTAPVFAGIGTSGAQFSSYASDLGGIVVVGRGDEEIRFARVSTNIGDNFTAQERPRTALSSPSGLFVAAPVIGAPHVIDPSGAPIQYTVEIFDRALNPAADTAVGTYRQIGAVGPGVALPGPMVAVTVFDADTLQPIPDALVMSHESDLGVVTARGTDTSDENGRADVPSAASGATLVTVQLAGFDSFTFHGVPAARLDVPLVRAATSLARVSGTVTTPFPSANFSNNTNLIGDNRLPLPGPVLGMVMSCALNSGFTAYNCPYGPLDVRAQRIGLTTFFASDPGLAPMSFTAAQFLVGFGVRGPDLPLDYGEIVVGRNIAVENALAFLPSGKQAVAIQTHLLTSTSAPSLGTVSTAPLVTIEGLGQGLRGAPTVGLGVPYAQGATSWAVLGAYPGDVSPTGDLVTRGAIDADLFVRAELIDDDGNRAGTRPRFSNSGGVLEPLDLPLFLVPGNGGTTGGDAYDIELANVIDAMPGLYRVTVTSEIDGRRWHLWTLDPPGAGAVVVSVPPVAASGGQPLADGPQSARVSAWAWPSLDPARFLWTDVERSHERFAHTRPTPFTQD